MKHLFAGSGSMIEQIGQIFALIRAHDGLTRQSLASRLDLPATTLNRSLERLLKAGLIRESGLADSSGGRRPSLYKINSQAGLLLGVDLSGPDARLVLTDLNLRVLGRRLLPAWAVPVDGGPAAALIAGCRDLAGQDHLAAGMIFGLGFCLPETGVLPPNGTAVSNGQSGETSASSDPAVLIQSVAADLQQKANSLPAASAGLYAGLWRSLPGSDISHDVCPLLELVADDSIGLGQIHLVNPAQSVLTFVQLSGMVVPASDKPAAGGTVLGQLATRPAMLKRFQHLKDDADLTWLDFCQGVQAGKRKARLVLQEAAAALSVACLNAAIATGSRHLLLAGDSFRDLPEYEAAVRVSLRELAVRTGQELNMPEHDMGDDLRAVGAAARALEQAINLR